MDIDWAQAWQIGGIGFGLVFVILGVLALATWLVSLIIKKIEGGEAEVKDEKEG